MEHEPFVRQAIDLAIQAGKKGNATFGALLVHDGQVLATAQNTEVTGDGFGHAEYNLVLKGAQRFPERVLQGSTLYTSTAPCPRCAMAILAAGIHRVVFSVSYAGFARLIPGEFKTLTIGDIVDRLDITGVEILGPFLEEEGMRAFQYWGGQHRPLEELLAEARAARNS